MSVCECGFFWYRHWALYNWCKANWNAYKDRRYHNVCRHISEAVYARCGARYHTPQKCVSGNLNQLSMR